MPDTPYRFQEKGRISVLQMLFLIITVVISTADVFLPAFIYQEAGRDSWLSVIIGTASTLVFSLVFLKLGMRYPDRTLVQYSCDILGRPLGKIVGILYTYFFIVLSQGVTRELSEILVVAFNPMAPITVYSAITLLVAAYAVFKGLEVVARVNQVVLPIGMALLVFITVINIPNMNFTNYLPVLAEGLVPPLRGAALIQAWLLEAFFILQLIPFIREKSKIKKYTLVSILLLGAGLMFGISIISVFGPLTGKLLFPALELVRYAKIGRYAQNLDIVIMGIWLFGLFMKVTILFYILLHIFIQVFNVRNGNYLIIPVAALIFSMSNTSPRILDIYNFAHYTFPLYIFAMAFIIPVILLLVSLIRKTGR